MYRSQDTTTKLNDFEHDDNYEFTGATLKILSNETVEVGSNNDLSSSNKILMENTNNKLNDSTTSKNIIDETKTEDANSNLLPNKSNIGSPVHFFSFRSGQFERAIDDIVNILLRPTNDTNILGKWLLTEISHWDHERERVFILTTKTLLVVKYDFIALRILQHNKIRLTQIDTIIRGKLTYPESSLVPRIEGITNGVTSVIQGNVFTSQQTNTETLSISAIPKNNNLALANRFDFSHFKPVERNDVGIRIMWNRGQPLPFLTSWNPFTTDIPWITFKNHPLYSYQDRFNSPSIQENLDKNRQIYSADNLYDVLAKLFSNDGELNDSEINYSCLFQDEPIIMQNYVGVGAVIHNKNNFGFFKVRGKFSF